MQSHTLSWLCLNAQFPESFPRKHCSSIFTFDRTFRARVSRHLATHLPGMQERSSVPLVAWPRSMHSHLNKTARENWSTRDALFWEELYVPVPLDESSSLWVLDSGRVGCCSDAAPVTVSDTTDESRDSAIFRLTPARVVKSARYGTARHGAARRDATATYLVGSPYIRTRGPLFRNFHTRQARDTGDAPTSRQMAVTSSCASVRHLAGRCERLRNNRIWSDRYERRRLRFPLPYKYFDAFLFSSLRR